MRGLLPDRGAPHAGRFLEMNAALRASGPGKPSLVLDLDALDRNVARAREGLAPGLAVRLVAKSLPSVPLLARLMDQLATRRLMVFDETLGALADAFPDADLLLGKPMPARSADAFLARHAGAAPRVRWLVDDLDRLAQYEALAEARGASLRVCVEIDVGLRRGGVPSPEALGPLLARLSTSRRLSFAGLMGYDAHTASAPPLLSSPARALAEAKRRYQGFVDRVRAHDPAWLAPPALRNGAGSKTFLAYDAAGPLDEVSFGSALVKPTDFDVPPLAAFEPALFLATPVLKRLEGTRVPFLEWAAPAWSALDPRREVTYFVYGGRWMARPVSPAGLAENPLYGPSTNQALLNGSRRTGLAVDDWIFLRPTQSERVLQELGDLLLFSGGALSRERWPALPMT